VVAVGWNAFQACDVGRWTEIIQVAAGYYYTVGLKDDGTVVVVGDCDWGQYISDWAGIIQVATGMAHTVGLKSDGTMVAVGDYSWGQCNVDSWTGIVQVAAGWCHTVGLKADGTVVAVGAAIKLAKWNLVLAVPPSQYVLTISSTAGGSVTSPGEGGFVRNAGVMVRIVAEPEAGYRLVNWTGDVDTIFNISAATTIITMRGDYSITANFEEIPTTNWPLIGGIIAAVVIVGLVIFFARRRKRKTAFETKLQQW
jgi:alpha-tubulin suppressor-like RCC1 family protein